MKDSPINFYEREFYMLSNFSAFSIVWKGQTWMTSEHIYQAEKFENSEIQTLIRLANSPYEAKKIARAHPELVRTDWKNIKLGLMEDILHAKLTQHPYIRAKLLETESRIIVENSPHDSYWGLGRDGNGENHLGKIWMKLRDEILQNSL